MNDSARKGATVGAVLADTSVPELEATNAPGTTPTARRSSRLTLTRGLSSGKSSTATVYIQPQMIYTQDLAGSDTIADAAVSILAKVNAATISVVSPVAADYTIEELYQGDDYSTTLGNQLSWSVSNWSGPDVTAGTVTFRLMTDANYLANATTDALSVTGSAVMSSTTAVFTVELTAAQTAALTVDPTDGKYNYRYQLLFTSAAGKVETLAQSMVTVLKAVP